MPHSVYSHSSVSTRASILFNKNYVCTSLHVYMYVRRPVD